MTPSWAIIISLTIWTRNRRANTGDTTLTTTAFIVTLTSTCALTLVIDARQSRDWTVFIYETEKWWNTSTSHAGPTTIAVVITLANNRFAYPLVATLIITTVIVVKAIGSGQTNACVQVAKLAVRTIFVTSTALNWSTFIGQADRPIFTITIIAAFLVIDARAGDAIAYLTSWAIIIASTPTGFLAAKINATAQRWTLTVDSAFDIILTFTAQANLPRWTGTSIVAFIGEDASVIGADFARAAIRISIALTNWNTAAVIAS